jgi:hypothetical protein
MLTVFGFGFGPIHTLSHRLPIDSCLMNARGIRVRLRMIRGISLARRMHRKNWALTLLSLALEL